MLSNSEEYSSKKKIIWKSKNLISIKSLINISNKGSKETLWFISKPKSNLAYKFEYQQIKKAFSALSERRK